ncbi:RHS repeat-associated core domain-containing protein [Dysgonomonas sp. 521]|uniref:RHS repeat-associated core domain-containing protein n=1 Tax=Dysgonomonas sp. 521 TaxID=2302932 RepID=UPI0013D3BB81|nr:RHS repeat-associated core domain-containing protein [Dysgonomonas sp. 521]
MFTETLYYNESYGGSVKQYNGNISAMSYLISGEATLYGYSYSYDNLSRLTKAVFLTSGNPNASKAYNMESISYDKHGNMKTMKLYGKSQSASYGALVDNLTMTYTGNQLVKVEDAAASVTIAESMDFKNYSNVATEYTYNKNGAMAKDLNKGITAIQYNSLNLPRMMDIKSPVAEARNEYTYSAGGQKLKVVQKWNPNFSTAPVIGSAINTAALTMTKTTDYVGNKVYENNALKRILVDGGYIEGTTYHFYMNDHLGNNRVVANASGTLVQKNHYYPFGSVFASTTGAEKQPYKYNGKELDAMHGVNLYDYSARYMDSQIGRFTSVDPLAEKYYSWSPYSYAANNPIRVIDPTGMDTIYFDHKGQLDSDKTRTRGNDVIYVTDSKGNIHSRSYESGTFNEYGYTQYSKTEDYSYISASNADASKSIFEFLADNTTSEWGNSSFLNISYYVTTSHNNKVEGGLSMLAVDKLLDKNAILTNDHSHPPGLPGTIEGRSDFPSGLPGSRYPKNGDIQALTSYVNSAITKLQPIPKFRIYVPRKGYRRYNINSTKKEFNRMPDFYYEK